MSDKMKVLLTTEGTYPFHQGGVSTWCDILINKLEPVDYVVYAILSNPFVTQKFKLPKGASLYTVPLWGTEEPSEHLSTPFPHIYLMKKQTGPNEIKEHFIPLFQELVYEIIAEVKDPRRFANILLGLYHFFQTYEYKESFKSEIVWDTYKKIILTAAADQSTGLSQPDVYGLVQSLGWLYRFFNIVNTPIPKVSCGPLLGGCVLRYTVRTVEAAASNALSVNRTRNLFARTILIVVQSGLLLVS